jgi:peptide deformylase
MRINTELLSRIRKIGDPILTQVSSRVNPMDGKVISARIELHSVLEAFRQQMGFGRAIAAPQIGYSMRMVALNMGNGVYTMHNPELFNKSVDTFTMW